jgi:CRP-like cAMP-binding protein
MRANLSTVARPGRKPANHRTARPGAEGVRHPGGLYAARLRASDMECLERLTRGSLLIPAGALAARHGYPLHDLLVVRSGRIQASITYPSGHLCVLREYRPGEIIGLDALKRGTYPADFRALERSVVCRLPRHLLDEL